MRKVVIDSNALRSPILAGFLESSQSNIAVVTDYCGIESHRESPLETVPKSAATLCRYPHQVLILKSTHALCRLSGRNKGLQRRLIDEKQTKDFPLYCRALGTAKAESFGIQLQLLANGSAAAKIIQEIEAGAPKFTDAISLLMPRYSSEDRALIRQGGVLTRQALDTLVNAAMETARDLFASALRLNVRPGYDELLNHYTFRYALCGQLLALRWGAHGGAEGAKLERMRNDLIDLHFAVCATYFDGFLSADQKSQGIYRQAREILRLMRLC
ncbi:MAG TPA: hypothetical protein VK580_10855 [Steroidobacteraceae bacterium]|nr:hypothetical protein [Steroidobacteraceae bacterium]